MTKFVALALLLVALGMLSTEHVWAEKTDAKEWGFIVTAQDLYTECVQAEANADALDGSLCAGYLSGYLHGLLIGRVESTSAVDRKLGVFCMPAKTASMHDVIRSYVQWIEKHPDALNIDVYGAVRDSLREGFPCNKESQPHNAP